MVAQCSNQSLGRGYKVRPGFEQKTFHEYGPSMVLPNTVPWFKTKSIILCPISFFSRFSCSYSHLPREIILQVSISIIAIGKQAEIIYMPNYISLYSINIVRIVTCFHLHRK